MNVIEVESAKLIGAGLGIIAFGGLAMSISHLPEKYRLILFGLLLIVISLSINTILFFF